MQYGIKLPGTLDRLAEALGELVPRARSKCKGYQSYTSKMEENMDSTVEEAVQQGILLDLCTVNGL